MDRPESAQEFVAFDLETTGLSPGEDRIIEVGAVRFDASGAILATFERLINSFRLSAPAARAIHGISDEILATAESARTVLPTFIEFLGDPKATTLLAHHSVVDAGFVGSDLLAAGLPIPEYFVVDTLAWSRRRWPHFGNHRLESLAQRFGGAENPVHRALADSFRVRQIFLALTADDPEPDRLPLAYPFHDGAGRPPIPRGWQNAALAIEQATDLQIEYAGGSHGLQARRVSPRKFSYRGGVAYLVAVCHHDQKIKEFQVDRIQNYWVASRIDS